MGSITQKIEDDWKEAVNWEERRKTYKPLGISFFDAMDGEGREDEPKRLADASPAFTVCDRPCEENKP